ncbi:MAG TPA: hypothetical protein ENJ56_05855, partial [Anaerolineae bacterium]|nr:hypothetical protein [Anaerolineae bacterium]
QVKAKARRKRHSIELPKRFQIAVDNAAMAAKITGTDGYLETFRWGERLEREGSPEAVAEAVSAEIIAQYPRIDWRKTAAELSHIVKAD